MQKFKYGYDIDGFYTGLEYPNNHGFHSSQTTELEPKWIDGYKPQFDQNRQAWRNIKKDDVRIIRAENFLVSQFKIETKDFYTNIMTMMNSTDKFMNHRTEFIITQSKFLADKMYDQESSHNKRQKDLDQILLEIRHLALKTDQKIETLYLKALPHKMQRLNFWQRLVFLFTKNIDQ